MQCNMIQVQEYFNCYLQRRRWMQLPTETQAAAVKMAEDDVKLALNCTTLDIGDLLVFCAVCEQALYLALAEAQTPLNPSEHGTLKSESVEGIGKREYYEKNLPAERSGNTSRSHLSPRSELFLSRLPAYGQLRCSRG